MAGNGNSSRTHGMSHTRPWNIWSDIKRRCNDTSRNNWEFYGACGITYEPSWEKFEAFWEDMGKSYSDDLTIDRVDPRGNYTKENCRWMPPEFQNKNKKMYCNNKTGVDGAYLGTNKGKPSLLVSICNNSRRFVRTYSLVKYSMEEALILARKWREEKKIEFGYGEFHGVER